MLLRHTKASALLKILVLAILVPSAYAAGNYAATNDENNNLDAYSSGYMLGKQLADIKQKRQPDFDLEAAFRGLRDALVETGGPTYLFGLEQALRQPDSRAGGTHQPAAPMARTRAFKDDYAAINAQRENVVVLPSGVQYEILTEGGGPNPSEDDTVLISYQGSLPSGIVFDTNYDEEGPLRIPVEKIVVAGLKEALLLMKKGSKWRVVIPPNLGFARFGNNQLRRRDLIYEVELVSIEKPADP